MRRKEKAKRVERIRQLFAEAEFAFLIDYLGMDVATRDSFKEELRKRGADCMVVKNTLAKRALEGMEVDGLLDALRGPTMVVFGREDVSGSAKAIRELDRQLRELPAGKVKAIWFEGRAYPAEEFRRFTELLTQEEARAKLLGLMKGVPQRLVGALANTVARLPRVLKAKAEQG